MLKIFRICWNVQNILKETLIICSKIFRLCKKYAVHVQIHSEHVKNIKNMFKYIHMLKMFRIYSKTFRICSKLLKICFDYSEYVKNIQNMLKYIHNMSRNLRNMFKNIQSMLKKIFSKR